MSLSDIFDNPSLNEEDAALAELFNSTAPAAPKLLLPAGEYPARAVGAKLDETRRGTKLYAMTLEVADGTHTGARLVARWYLSPAALPYSRRDLEALGLDVYEKLKRGDVPDGPLRMRVALQTKDDGSQRNEVLAVFPGATPTPKPNSPSVCDEPHSDPAPPAGVEDLPADLLDPDFV